MTAKWSDVDTLRLFGSCQAEVEMKIQLLGLEHLKWVFMEVGNFCEGSAYVD